MNSRSTPAIQNAVLASGLFGLNQEILRLFWVIDQEAKPVEGDYPTGLWWYTGHLDRAGPSREKLNAEVCWSRRLSELLEAQGCTCRAEGLYPQGSRQRCDVVFDVGCREPFWLEVKDSWRAKFDPPKPNSAYRKHLLAAAEDIDKLMALGPNEACGIAFVLVGFDQPAQAITEADLSDVRGRTASKDWHRASAQWHVDGRVKFRVNCWIWSRWR